MIEKVEEIVKRKDISVIANISYKDEETFQYPFKLTPLDFLKFAKEDFNEKNTRNLVNALSNIKRAINCQIDQILFIFGFSKKRWKFPEKIEFIKDIGIISPEIIKKINKKRNLIEHEYDIPSLEGVSDAIGIAELFIESVKPIFIRYYKDLEVHDDSRGRGFPCIYFDFDYKKPLFKVAYKKEEGSKSEEVEYNHKHQDYLKIVEYYIKFLKERY
ncbi:MAG: hypothetical protein KAV25_08645 [Methanophagales archaeon]|nr:hypothetical protein [Methanophagales archaeon]